MIRCLIPALLLSSLAHGAITPAPSWSKTVVDELKSKTLQQAFCDKAPGLQTQATCDYLKKNKMPLTDKLTNVSVNGNTLTITIDKRSLEIKRTASETQFEVNRKMVDLASLREPSQLLNTLKAALPKSARHSLWMNAAFAEEESNYELMVRTSALILSSTVDKGLCVAAHNFAVSCQGNTTDAPEMTQFQMILDKIKAGKILNSDEDRWLEADTNDQIVGVYRLREITKGLDNAQVRKSLQACPAAGLGPKDAKSTAESDLDACIKILDNKRAILMTFTKETRAQQAKLIENLNKVSLTAKELVDSKKTAAKSTKKESGAK